MEDCLSQISATIPQIFFYSAKYFMRLGSYQQCLLTEGMDYYTIIFNGIGNNIAVLYTSLCLPKVCEPNLVKEAIDGVAILLNSDLRVAQINNRIPQKEPEYTWVFYLTISLLTILTMLVILTSIFSKLRKNKVLDCFSLQSSLKVFKYNEKSNLNVLNGVRSLCMFWVILGHQYSLVIINTSNILSINDILSTWTYLLIQAGILAVDLFFFVGGFLVAYSILKQVKVKSSLRYLLAILNRYLRFIPSYFVAILIYYSILTHLVSGPFWYENTAQVQNCSKMWKPLLFVDNFVDNGNSQCMGWGWYLQNDMQIFCLSVLILFIYGKSRFWSFFAIFLTIFSSFAFTMQKTFDDQYKYTTHMTDFTNYGDYMSNIYIKPWSRCPPYIIGLFLGMIYVQFINSSKKKEKLKQVIINISQQSKQHSQCQDEHFLVKFKQYLLNNPWKRRLVQVIGILVCLFIIFIPRTAQGDQHYWSQLTHSLFLTYSKAMFVVGVALIIFPSILGIKGLVRFTMDTKAFNFIAKISFWTYLIHLTIMYQWITSIKIDFYYAYLPLFTLFATTATQSMLLGFTLSVLVEFPFAKFQKYLIEGVGNKTNKIRQKKQKQKQKLILNQSINE